MNMKNTEYLLISTHMFEKSSSQTQPLLGFNNIFFLISGLILGIFIYYFVERIKEGRLRKKIASVIINEIEVCKADAEDDIKRVEKIELSELPDNIQKERFSLSAFAVSPALYGINVYQTHLDRIYLFRSDTQKAIINFYNIIFKIIRDLGSIKPLAQDIQYPPEMVTDIYEIQVKLRNRASDEAGLCILELETEKRASLVNWVQRKFQRKSEK